MGSRSTSIDTDRFSALLRERSIDIPGHKVLLTNFSSSDQEEDLTLPPNCNGLGRIRHFRMATAAGWPPNPLPIEPACRALGLSPRSEMLAQVFQNAACNWRCWYCYVPFSLLSANPKHSAWIDPEDLIDLYLQLDRQPLIVDLSGGQPDLVPEWTLWTLRALQSRGVDSDVYVWSDDNLSNDYFWRYLSDADRTFIAAYKTYGRVGCFKGFDQDSFAYNTKAAPELFERQFMLFERLITTGIDLYAYATFTCTTIEGMPSKMAHFVDRLQRLSTYLPLRTVPLHISLYSPVEPRLDLERSRSMEHQQAAIAAWNAELERRFSPAERAQRITDIRL